MAKKKIAAIVTEYRPVSHADVIIGKILEGPNYDGQNLYDLEIVSLFTDQLPKTDMSRALAKKHGFKICATIADALTLGAAPLAVDGVMCIGEHGNYPKNDLGQILYPRRRFFEEVAKVFERTKKSVPVFNDKHLAATWEDAQWMYKKSLELKIPFMAGSSIPHTWRKPDLTLKKDCEIEEVVMLGYGPVEGYGFHALEGMQCQLERRRGGETGVKSVRAVTGPDMWKEMEKGTFSQELLEETIRLVPAHAPGSYRGAEKAKDAAIFIIEYIDGPRAALAMLNGFLYEGDGGAIIFASKVKGEAKLQSCQYYLQQPDPFAHFGYQVNAFEATVRLGHPPFPIERTLLTTGILDAAMKSLHQNGKKIETPHLKIAYKATDWPHATGPIAKAIKRERP